MSLCESPLTLIEEAAHGSCRSTNSLWGGVCVSPSVFQCVCMCEGETCWALNQSEPVLGHSSQCCVGVFSVTGSHNSAFSRWFPAGLRMTCDNITVLKGQAWREPVGGLGQSQAVQTSNTVLYTHIIMQCMGLMFKRKGLLCTFKHPVLNILLTRQCKYLLYYLNLGGLSRRRREGAAIFACW